MEGVSTHPREDEARVNGVPEREDILVASVIEATETLSPPEEQDRQVGYQEDSFGTGETEAPSVPTLRSAWNTWRCTSSSGIDERATPSVPEYRGTGEASRCALTDAESIPAVSKMGDMDPQRTLEKLAVGAADNSTVEPKEGRKVPRWDELYDRLQLEAPLVCAVQDAAGVLRRPVRLGAA